MQSGSTNNFKAIRYTSNLRLNEILKNEGDAIKVFIPVEHFTNENPLILQQHVYGSRPYSLKSDLVAVCTHMGILFPGEKPKKNSTDALFTAPNAPRFGIAENPLDDSRKIEDNFRFFGVVLALIAVPGLENYHSIRGYYISSQSLKDSNPIAFDVLDYSFISEFEPMPEFVDDPFSILTKVTQAEYFTPIEEDDLLTYKYSRKLFLSDREGYLFRDFKVLMYTTDGKILQFKWTRNNLALLERNQDPADPEEKSLLTSVKFSDIKFLDNGIQVNDKFAANLEKIILQPPETTSID